MNTPDARAQSLQHWLDTLPGAFEDLRLLRADASFRRYFRARRDGVSVVIMDAPPEREATEPFVRIARLLEGLGLRPPRVLEHEPDSGFVLLEDLGDRTFTRALAEGANEWPLYQRALDTLATLHQRWPEQGRADHIPPYDRERLLAETALYADWYWPRLRGHAMPEAMRAEFDAAWHQVLEALPGLPDALVLRDFHVDNLMLPPGDEQACALLDFQDAVIGSPAYDVVSLLEDARREVSADTVARGLEHYLANADMPRASFMAHYHVLGIQRTVKILGIFVRLAERDGKPRYLEHLPRLHRLLEQGLRHPELGPVARWFAAHAAREHA
ncbi:aminoglycoside phosphotransferase family protein [Thioalkalivibrio sp. ALJ9]|uniref:aminoglycoside phosphotransferase family protein n=1 Tax=Thioalkalivibrio sp. ALJ9 TaxID=1158758 RepID=UPI00036FA6B1|nr:phosphotransferase [Thioalkalivibrio sp. ALJ9]